MNVDGSGFRILSRQECLRMLSTVYFGRLGLCCDALPVVLPITFALDGETIVFRTARGGQLAAATTDAVVAFETDHVDPAGSLMWSVAATGVASEITDHDERERARGLALGPWGGEGVERFARLSLEVLSGRQGAIGASTAPPVRDRPPCAYGSVATAMSNTRGGAGERSAPSPRIAGPQPR